MQMFTNKVGAPTKIAVALVLLLSVITLPSVFNYCSVAGIGHSYHDLRKSGISHEQARERAMQDGMKGGILMLLGQHIPITVLALIMVGLISKSTTAKFKRMLRFLYFVTAAGGVFFLSLGTTYWGQGTPFPSSLGPALVIYVVISAILWAIIGIGVAISGKMINRKEKNHEI